MAGLWCRRHRASIIQIWELAAVVSFHLMWEKPLLSSLRHDEACWSLSFQGPVSSVFVTPCMCVSVGVWECVFALCSLLWECCSRWGLLTELELSFHTGGNSFFWICRCVCLPLPLPLSVCIPLFPRPSPLPLPPSCELTFFISLLLYSCCDVGQGWGGEQLKIRQDRTLSLCVCLCVSVWVCFRQLIPLYVVVCLNEREEGRHTEGEMSGCWVLDAVWQKEKRLHISLCLGAFTYIYTSISITPYYTEVNGNNFLSNSNIVSCRLKLPYFPYSNQPRVCLSVSINAEQDFSHSNCSVFLSSSFFLSVWSPPVEAAALVWEREMKTNSEINTCLDFKCIQQIIFSFLKHKIWPTEQLIWFDFIFAGNRSTDIRYLALNRRVAKKKPWNSWAQKVMVRSVGSSWSVL